jgi:radical SAM superfamily enzyme YgiQ (UPF0313 family)
VNILFLVNDYLTQPLGVAYLSGVLQQAGHRTEVAALRDVPRQKLLLQEFTPHILCLSLVTGQHSFFLRTAQQIKHNYPHLLILAGGPHPTFYPEFIYEEGIDALCRGEGELSLPSMVDVLAAKGRLPEHLPNWWIKLPSKSVVRNDVGPLIENLDILPYPDRDVFDRAQRGVRRRTIYVMTSRGCPYRCSYCFNHAYNKLYHGKDQVYRQRSVTNLVGELTLLKQKYPLQIIVFQDDTFNLNRAWLKEFANRYPQEIGIPFHCHLRADLLDDAITEMLKHAGCFSVKLGLESAREHIRNGILNRAMSLEEFENACRLLHKHGIRFATENILAIPGSSLDDDCFTYEINCQVKPHHSFATLMQAYPRTDIATYAIKHGFVNSQPHVFPHTFYHDSSINLEDKERRGRLRALFALGVSFGLPVSVVRRLTAYHLRMLYECIDKVWKGYCLRFRIYPYRHGPVDFIRETFQYLCNKYY